jgi:hypothetical protein
MLPLGAVVVTLRRLAGRTKWMVLAVAAPTIILSVFLLLGISLDLAATTPGESDIGFAPIHRISLPHGGALVVYRTNCGATCDFGIVVRQERALIPGLLLVRNVYGKYPAHDALVEITAPDRARVQMRELRLRRWVYL